MGSQQESVRQPDDAPREAQSSTLAPQPLNPASPPTNFFWARIKRHKVVEWTLAYVAFGYALLHGVQMLRETFEWPLLIPRLTVVGLVLGAPIAVTLAWYHGHRARHRVSGGELSILIALLVVAGSVLWWVSRHERSGGSTASRALNTTASQAAFNPPAHSIAVLPFVNMSGDKEQEYFSEGLTEELLNSLSRINELQVAARTSSFSFTDEHPDIATVAHRLNVGAVLEGSVRRSADTVRISAQLVSGVTGFHLWSSTYDRGLGDVLKLQTEIATAVASALKVTLLGDEGAKIELGGTRNAAAFDAYLRGSKAYSTQHNPRDLQSAAAAYTEAIRLDPDYALAFAGRSMAFDEVATMYQTGTAQRANFDGALADAQRAITLAPELGDAHLALARVLEDAFFDFARANDEYVRAVSLAPGNARVLQRYGNFAANMGHTEAGLAASRRAVILDPLSTESHRKLGEAQWVARRYNEAVASFKQVITLDPQDSRSYAWRGLAYYGLGQFQSALASCDADPGGGERGYTLMCLALVQNKLGRHAEAEAMLERHRVEFGDRAAYQYADIYSQWGNAVKALEWLQTAVRLRDTGLGWLKTDPLLDPLRKEPRFQAIERALKFPD